VFLSTWARESESLEYQMKIGFFRGWVSAVSGREARLWWAHFGNEYWAIEEGFDEVTRGIEHPPASSVERITELELPEIDEEGVETIMLNILKGRFLEKPGVKDSEEAVLFILVNEAIQTLKEIEKAEMSS
jgi:hypothetical protein